MSDNFVESFKLPAPKRFAEIIGESFTGSEITDLFISWARQSISIITFENHTKDISSFTWSNGSCNTSYNRIHWIFNK